MKPQVGCLKSRKNRIGREARHEAQHCSSLCLQSEGDEYSGGLARAENSTRSCPRFSQRVRGPHFASKVSYNEALGQSVQYRNIKGQRVRHGCKRLRADIRRRSEAKHCSSLCLQSEGDEYSGGLARAENSTRSCPRFSQRVRGPHFASKVSYNEALGQSVQYRNIKGQRVRHGCKRLRADIRRRSEAKHCSSLCLQSEGDEYCGGQARAENSTRSCPRFSPHVRGPHFASKVSYSAIAPDFATCSWPSLCEQSELQCCRLRLRPMSVALTLQAK